VAHCLRVCLETPAALHCVPNPASSTANLVFDAQTDFEGNIAIQDNFGKAVKVVPYQFRAGRNVIEVPKFDQLPAGVLNITIDNGSKKHTARLVKI
jgi:hypothetical protein